MKESSQKAKNNAEDLIEALRTCNEIKIKNILNKELDLNIVTDEGYTALHCACYVKDYAILEDLVKKSFNAKIIDHLDKYGDTALMKAIYKNNPILVKLLLIHQADVTIINRTSTQDTILHYLYTGKMKDIDAIELLIKKTKETGTIEVKNNQGITPLSSAILNKDTELVKLLLKYKPKYKIIKDGNCLTVDNVHVSEIDIQEIFTQHVQEVDIKTYRANLGQQISLILEDLLVGDQLLDHQKIRQTKQINNIKKYLNQGAQLPIKFAQHLWKIKDQELLELIIQEYKKMTNDNDLEILLKEAIASEDVKLIELLLKLDNGFEIKIYEDDEYFDNSTVSVIQTEHGCYINIITNPEISDLLLTYSALSINNDKPLEIAGAGAGLY